MVQWLRVLLAMPGILVRSLVWEDPTCLRATKPRHHNIEVCNKRSHCNEKPPFTPMRESPLTAMKTQHSQKIR